MEFELHPLAGAYAGMIAWPAARGADVIAAYLEWVKGLPEEMSAWVRFLTLPPIPEVPEHLRGVPLVDVTAAYAGPESEGAELLRPLLELGEPMMNTFATIPAAGLAALNGDPEQPVPGLGDGDLLGETRSWGWPVPAPAARCCRSSCDSLAVPSRARRPTAGPPRASTRSTRSTRSASR
jgi:hypothetical protein